jgi:hypothetical protein
MLNDALVAFGSLVGVAVLFAIAMIAAGAFYRRDMARRSSQGTQLEAGPVFAEHPTQSDDRELVLR